jgi:hypothetical protein
MRESAFSQKTVYKILAGDPVRRQTLVQLQTRRQDQNLSTSRSLLGYPTLGCERLESFTEEICMSQVRGNKPGLDNAYPVNLCRRGIGYLLEVLHHHNAGFHKISLCVKG